MTPRRGAVQHLLHRRKPARGDPLVWLRAGPRRLDGGAEPGRDDQQRRWLPRRSGAVASAGSPCSCCPRRTSGASAPLRASHARPDIAPSCNDDVRRAGCASSGATSASCTVRHHWPRRRPDHHRRLTPTRGNPDTVPAPLASPQPAARSELEPPKPAAGHTEPSRSPAPRPHGQEHVVFWIVTAAVLGVVLSAPGSMTAATAVRPHPHAQRRPTGPGRGRRRRDATPHWRRHQRF